MAEVAKENAWLSIHFVLFLHKAQRLVWSKKKEHENGGTEMFAYVCSAIKVTGADGQSTTGYCGDILISLCCEMEQSLSVTVRTATSLETTCSFLPQ